MGAAATVSLVPVRGPSSAIGTVTSVPIASPTAHAVTVLHQPRPNVIGSQPKTITENARFPPKNTAGQVGRRESRAASGMNSIPRVYLDVAEPERPAAWR